jgi:type II secretory pathway pseudopilin PulG
MPGKKLTAFTLIELLVVCGIIAVLIGILVPSIGKARATAKRTRCQANLHSVGQAIRAYMDEYHGFYPPMSVLKEEEPALNPRKNMAEVLKLYVGNQLEVFHCPADIITDSGTNKPPAGVTTYFQWQGSSYQPRVFLSINDPTKGWELSRENRFIKALQDYLKSEVEDLTTTVLAHDYEAFHGSGGPGSQMGLFADFHVDDMGAVK